MNRIITDIIVKTGEEECRVDVEKLHEMLLALPAEKYIELYYEMKRKIEGHIFYNFNAEENNDLIDADWNKYAFSEARK